MKLLLARLVNYWQFRWVTIAGCLGLVAYAMVMPVHSTESVSSSQANIEKPGLTEGKSDHSGSALIEDNAGGESVRQEAVARSHSSASLTPSALPLAPTAMPTIRWTVENRELSVRLMQTAKFFQEQELPRDAGDVILALRSAAAKSDPVAQFLLGNAYQTGLGVPKDLPENARWYSLAESIHGILKGDGGLGNSPANFGEAFASYRLAAENGDSTAELYLGLAYDRGEGVPQDRSKAAIWYKRAADKGSVSAACNLGELYHDGQGLPKDSLEATTWLRWAAERGSASAQYGLGRSYLWGDGVPVDEAKAAIWLLKAAEQGNVPSQVILSSLYATGKGVSGSAAEAYMWINLAAAHDAEISEVRDAVESDLSVTVVSEGQRLTHQWSLRHKTHSRVI